MNAEYNNDYKKLIVTVTTFIKTIIEDETGLRLDQVCDPLSKGGGSTDGNQAQCQQYYRVFL